MTREDIQKLIGGYATGTLTDAERKMLFEAALDDQELFDELGREQSLKEVLDEPGAKSRLIAALARPDPAPVWWKRPLTWATSAVATAAVAVVVFVSLRHSQPLQVALAPAETPAAAMAVPASTPPPAAKAEEPVRSNAPAAAGRPAPAKREAVAQDATNRLEKDRLEKKAEEKPDSQTNPKDADQKTAQIKELAASGRQVVAAEPPPASPPPPPQQPEARKQVAENSQSVAQSPLQTPVQAQAQSQPSGPSQRTQSVGGFLGGQAGGGRAAPALRAARPARFGFDYLIEGDRQLVVNASAGGYLSVSATASKLGLIFPASGDGLVSAGSTTRISIPAGIQTVTIVFSATGGGRRDPAALTDSLSSVSRSFKRDTTSGTVEDSNPSANSRLVVELKIQP